MVGLNPTKLEIDHAIGSVAQAFFVQFRRAQVFKYWLDGKLDSELTTLGYDATDIANLRSAALKLDYMRQIWEGLVDSPQEDYRTFPRRVAGIGDI